MRYKASRADILESFGNKEDKTYQIKMRKMRGEFRPKKLYTNLIVPSYVHGYSLAIEFMRNWFLEKFPKDYFKTVYVNGKHVLDDYKYFNRDVIKKEKPMVAIVPTVDYDFDREYIDMYLSEPDIFLKRSNYQNAFFKDPERQLFLGLDFQALKMTFNFRIRVSSRAQQLDLFKRMELMFRIGATQQKNVSADFHIPKYVLADIARKAGFEVDDKDHIKDVMEFVEYFNRYSDIPIMFKMRAINQQPEFFIRVRDMYTHIACKDKISVDDGERDGQLDNNFHLEMQAELTIPVPHYYVYFQSEPIFGGVTIHEQKDMVRVGLYSFSEFEIPDKNKQGWYQVALTSYLTDKNEQSIDMTQVFAGHTNLDIVLRYRMKNFLSPTSFTDIQVFRNDDRAQFVKSYMDWNTMKLNLLDEVDEETLYIVIYADREYINETIISIEQYKRSRIDSN